MIKVLLLLPDQLDKPMGGMGEQARNLIENFSVGFNFLVLGPSSGARNYGTNFSYEPLMDLSISLASQDAFSDIFVSQSLYVEKGISVGEDPDIIHAFDWSTFHAGRVLSAHFGKPLVVTVQLSIRNHLTLVNPLQQLQFDYACGLETAGLMNGGAIIQVSENYRSLFPRIFSEKTFVIHNGINQENWIPEKEVILPGDRPVKLVYIGRFAEMKNLRTLLSCTIPDEIDLIFIGDTRGGTTELFDSMLQRCNDMPNFHYAGPKYGQEKIDWLCAADAVIVPSLHEPFGIVALEALASKSILISSFVNGMADFLTADCAINCGISRENIETALSELLSLTKPQKEAMIESGLKVCETHHWSKIALQVEQVYKSVIN